MLCVAAEVAHASAIAVVGADALNRGGVNRQPQLFESGISAGTHAGPDVQPAAYQRKCRGHDKD
jgi:hypothetical protein